MSVEAYVQLVETIRHHDFLYYIESQPEISDYEYDQLYKKLEQIEREHPDWVIPSSPTQVISDSTHDGFTRKAHASPMLSLANTYSFDELNDFIKRMEKLLEKQHPTFCAELKMDGLAVSLRYEKGTLVHALTRGDGKQGDDITRNIKTLKHLPHHLKDAPDVLEVRAEVFMPIDVFTKINDAKKRKGEEHWANPRNAAAGSLKLLDTKEVYRRKLDFIAFGIIEDSSHRIAFQHEVAPYLKSLGFPTFDDGGMRVCSSLDDLKSFAGEIQQKRHTMPFEIDGMVVKLDDIQARRHLGSTAKTPRWAVAYKFAAERAKSIVEAITVQVGRTGVLTPVAELKPVFVAGSTIARATLHNADEIKRKDIRVGDHVWIEKGGDVIPKVVEVIIEERQKDAKAWQMPKTCPSCGEPVHQEEGEVAYRCLNHCDCPAQNLRKIIFFASKPAMDIEDLGDKVVEKLAQAGFVQKFSDIYRLTKEELLTLEGFKEKSAQNLIDAIEKSKKQELYRLILALGIPFIGKGTAELLANYSKNVERFVKLKKEEIIDLEGIGEKVADALIEYLAHQSHLDEIEALLGLGLTPTPPKEVHDQSHPFFGKTFVLTGTLANFTRTEAAALIKEKGGKVSSSVSAKTDYVLYGEEAGSKLKKGQSLGVALMTEEEFRNYIG